MAERTSNRWIWPALLVALVVVLAVVALNRGPVELDPATPEGTVQAYLQAISDSDYDAAFGYLDPARYDGCTPADLATHIGRGETFTAVLDTENVETLAENEAIVPVQMHFGRSGVMTDGWTTWESFVLSEASGAWLITQEAWPYFAWSCQEEIP